MTSKDLTPITVQTTVKAGINIVWDCWTKPDHITEWNFANDEWCCPSAENDLKPNGKFSWRMEAKNGSMGFDLKGNYKKVVKNELISYAMSDGRLVEIIFLEKDNHVIISETFEPEGTNSNEQQRGGWLAILENFKSYVESIA